MYDVKIRGISLDSRRLKRGYIFVAIPGTKLDGRQFVSDAIMKGASALMMSNRDIFSNTEIAGRALPVIGVEDLRLSVGLLASEFYGNPSKKMALIGITGTNGKTTITYLLEGILNKAGLSPGVIGTINQRHGDMQICSELTTPDAIKLQEILANMLNQGAKAVALEVSSHAIDQKRISGCKFTASIFTNLGRDHLDYHQDIERYFQTKAKLFSDYQCDTSIINIDDIYGIRLWEMIQSKKISYGLSLAADVRPVSQSINRNGIRIKLVTPKGSLAIRSKLIGFHNLYNILAAVAASISMGIDPNYIQTGIESIERIPGRLDSVPAPAGVYAFIDYAHTPDALDSVLNSLIRSKFRPLICVIGCGGDRDKGKRPLMAQTAAALSDVLVITSDNPRTEDPLAIIDQMLSGLRDIPPYHPAHKSKVKVIPDRREAIIWAAEKAIQSKACLLVAGKGHETCQIIGGGKIFFDDREVLKEAFEKKNKDQRLRVNHHISDNKSISNEVESCQDQGTGLRISQLVAAIGAEVVSGELHTIIHGISTDSRSLKIGDIFWALSGRHFNGHDFVLDAFKKGAIGAVIGSDIDLSPLILDFQYKPILLKVHNTLKALGDFAAWYKEHIGIKVVGVTGSCGKTTTKEMIFSVLKKQYNAAKTRGNFNNLIGLPLSLLSAKYDDSWAVLEMGTNQPGEISKLCGIAKPQVGLITTIQPAHLENLGDIKKVAIEKWELWKALPQKGVAVVNLDDPLVLEGSKYLKCQAVGYSMQREVTSFPGDMIICLSWRPEERGTILDLDIAGNKLLINLPLIGKSNVQNAVAAAATGYALSLTPDLIKQGLEEVKPVPGRLFLMDSGTKWRLIDDSYNANPSSMKAALETLSLWNRGGKKIAILGDMLELGDTAYNFHHDLGRFVAYMGIDFLVCVGQFAQAVSVSAQKAGILQKTIRIFSNKHDLLSWIESGAFDRLPSPATILVKGSRSIGLEKVVEALMRHLR
jgi:murE/murF fusion protein